MKNIFKKIFKRCNNLSFKTDIYSREGNLGSNMYSYDKLRGKSIIELNAMLADDTFSTLDDISNAFILDRIADVLLEKENIPKSQLEEEADASWERFLDKYDNELHICQDDVTVKRRKATKTSITDENHTIEQRQFIKRHKIRRTVTAVATAAAVILACNAFTTFAYGTNLLQAIVSFTDEVFRKDYVNPESVSTTDGHDTTSVSVKYATLREAFVAFGITSPNSPEWLPEGFKLVSIEIIPIDGGNLISAFYQSSEKNLSISVKHYTEEPSNLSRAFEKSDEDVEIYIHAGHTYYIFSNIDRSVATWIDGMTDYTIQGDISTEEIKRIIISMYDLEE
jgi:anti-sigma factor RsiW